MPGCDDDDETEKAFDEPNSIVTRRRLIAVGLGVGAVVIGMVEGVSVWSVVWKELFVLGEADFVLSPFLRLLAEAALAGRLGKSRSSVPVG
jgi:hypothetical protein